MTDQTDTPTRSVLATLRALTPQRPATLAEALRVAELQAHRLLGLWRIDEGPVPMEVVTELPRIRILRAELPVSGTSYWNGSCWIIALNQHESRTRQRFTLLHEFKHIIDHGRVDNLYLGDRRRTTSDQAELAADYFAGCVLMPRPLLKRAWCAGLQTPLRLARHFDVSAQAADVRLSQTGLSLRRDRCSRPMESTRHHVALHAVRPHWRTA